MRKDYVTICPNCGSTDVSTGGGISASGYCMSCGYGKGGIAGHAFYPTGVFFPEIKKSDINNFKANLKKKSI